MRLGTLARIAIAAVCALVVSFEFISGFSVIGCEVTERRETFRRCQVTAVCEDGATRDGSFRLGRYDHCPAEAWYFPLWGQIRKPSIVSGYTISIVVVALGALAFGPAGLLNPRSKDPGPPYLD